MNFLNKRRSNLESVTSSLLESLGVRVTQSTIKTCLINHPYYPSIISISDCLSEVNVRSQTYKIRIEEYSVDDLLFPFIAHIKQVDEKFVLVNDIKNGIVEYSDEAKAGNYMKEMDFLKKWSGIALHADVGISPGETKYFMRHIGDILKLFLLPVTIILGFLIFFGLVSFNSLSPIHIILCILKLLGIGVSILLLLQSLDSKNSVIQNLCKIGARGDCENILKSDAAQLTPWLSWSEVGFFYFTITLVLVLIQPNLSGIVAWVNLLALPYTIYSIWYQLKNKHWCALCCTVQAILWGEFFVNFLFGSYGIKLENNMFYYLTVSFLIPIVSWAFLKEPLKQLIQIPSIKHQLNRLKYDTKLFNQILINQPNYEISDDLMPIIIGNPHGSTIITMVSSPLCKPCAKAHRLLDEWTAIRPDIQVKVVFATSDQDDDKRTKVARHLSKLVITQDKGTARKALNDWYTNDKNFEEWKACYPTNENESAELSVTRQKTWCELAQISHTPTILINGYKLPKGYDLADLKYLLN